MAQKLSKLVKDLHRNIHTKFHSNLFSGSQEEVSWNIPLYIDLIQYGDDDLLILCVFTSVLCRVNKEVKENNNNNKKPNPILAFYIQTRGAQTTI
jgi:hypothetical protein